MRRVLNWDCKLVSWARAQTGKPFEWGKTDCVSLARGAIVVMYDEDLFPDLDYTTMGGAARMLERYGTLMIALSEKGAATIAPEHGRTGDILISPANGKLPGAMVQLPNSLMSCEVGGVVTLYRVRELPDDMIPMRLPTEGADG